MNLQIAINRGLEVAPTGKYPIVAAGKFFWLGSDPFCMRGVTYGTFGPDQNGDQFPSQPQVTADFGSIAARGFNTVRTYTTPPERVLDAASEAGLRLLAGLTWEQHIAFLEDKANERDIRERVRRQAESCAGHPSILGFTIG